MGKKVLVIDDEEDIRELVGFCIEKVGHSMVEAANGTVGIEVYKEEKPDLIITDINMPGGDDGWTFLENLEKIETSSPPVIIMTGYTNNEEKAKGTELNFLQKPFSMDQFMTILKEALEQ